MAFTRAYASAYAYMYMHISKSEKIAKLSSKRLASIRQGKREIGIEDNNSVVGSTTIHGSDYWKALNIVIWMKRFRMRQIMQSKEVEEVLSALGVTEKYLAWYPQMQIRQSKNTLGLYQGKPTRVRCHPNNKFLSC